MQEIIRTNDRVLLSFVRASLEEEEVGFLVADGNMSVLEERGLAEELRPETP